MSYRKITITKVGNHIGSRVSGTFNAGWGDYFPFDGTLLAVSAGEHYYIYLEICECRGSLDCEGVDTHGGYRFFPEEEINVHF